MSTVLTVILVIGSVAVVLAVLLVIAEAFLANYGVCKIVVNKDKEYEMEGGRSLLASLKAQSIFVPSACGGRGSCGYCKVKILDGAGPLLPTELPFLTQEEIDDNIRISCQIKVRNDIEIELPEEILSLREYRTTVTSIRDLTHDVKEIVFKLAEGETMDFVAGQYVQLETPVYGALKEPVYRAYSMANPPAQNDEVLLFIRRVPEGICTTWVCDILKEGDEVTLSGPYGDFRMNESDADIIMVAGSTGLAPIYSLLLDMKDKPEQLKRKCWFFFGNVAGRDMFYLDELRELEKEYPNFTFVPAASSPREDETWEGETGLVTDVMDRYIDDFSAAEAYLCGSPGMIDACIKVFTSKGMKEENIFYDKFA